MSRDVVKDGGPAFPASWMQRLELIAGSEQYVEANSPGMTLRDYLASSALRGMAGHLEAMFLKATTTEECELEILNAAVLSYRIADAMLREREKVNAVD